VTVVVIGSWVLVEVVAGTRVVSSTAEPVVPRALVLVAGLGVPQVEGVGLVQ
jgi:hypothetical protein